MFYTSAGYIYENGIDVENSKSQRRKAMNTQLEQAAHKALGALEQTLQTLDDANAMPGGPIADTIWHTEHETLFDYLASEITALREALEQPAQPPMTDEKYNELLFAVGNKFPGETRHETALRYIRQAESQVQGAAKAAHGIGEKK